MLSKGAAADTVRNMGPDVPLDTIIKKFTIVYGNVKSFDLLMRDSTVQIRRKRSQFLPLLQGWEGLLSQIHDSTWRTYIPRGTETP